MRGQKLHATEMTQELLTELNSSDIAAHFYLHKQTVIELPAGCSKYIIRWKNVFAAASSSRVILQPQSVVSLCGWFSPTQFDFKKRGLNSVWCTELSPAVSRYSLCFEAVRLICSLFWPVQQQQQLEVGTCQDEGRLQPEENGWYELKIPQATQKTAGRILQYGYNITITLRLNIITDSE